MLCIVSVVDSISATSMPINEFVIYRSKHNYDVQQILIVCDNKKPDDVNIPNDIEIYLVGHNKKRIRTIVKDIIANKGSQLVFHLHHQKSALTFMCATVGLHIRKKLLYTVHSTYGARDLKYKLSSCICAMMTYKVNCVSKAAFDDYSTIIKKIKAANFTYVTNGVDIDRIAETISSRNKIKERKTLIYVGRMIPIKNHIFLVELMNKLPDFKMIFVGAEDSQGHIREMVNSYGLANQFEFAGLIPREEVFRKLMSASIYVSPSLVEGLPVSVLEAMSVGLVPILSNIKPHEEIESKCDDVMAIPLEINRWVDVINSVSSLSEKDYVEKSEKIREVVEKEFSLNSMHAKYMNIYHELVINQ